MSRKAWDDRSKREYSVKLLKALTSKETAFSFAEKTGMLSNVDIGNYSVHYNRLTQRGQELLKHSKELIGPPDSFVDRSAWEGIIVKKFPYILEGKESPQTLWDEAEKQSIAD